ncbi:imidazole glycerol phosphate synthase subunit HisH [Waterburya agarophytonicola K14]|uniref:Imidazole glycerol phosphate synthase subunit HisH n=1 Tax=Waterburya agarophytonicola KI4 TaxID=2874699 RepID=A0A964FF74_9CYAN|nr:imidazole glycerol phosphate synthase subunit HisH [Waterburya agarophytonicola]MCC0176621.1 imidazole glycerol phosphate synthase subunit HisH [Waterburya agarophytonicola KI4]
MVNVAVIDYDMGNLHSACKGLEKAGAVPKITYSPEEILSADAVVLPGVGAFDPAMRHIGERNLEPVIKKAIASGKPFLGICVGLQLLFDGSEEGTERGLGIIPGMVKRFRSEPNITIPQMGWNQLELIKTQHFLWQNIPADPYLYFVHSFYVDPIDKDMIAATVTHGTQTVTAAIANDNLMAVQFHPEKSSDNGLQILSNFVTLVENSRLIAK